MPTILALPSSALVLDSVPAGCAPGVAWARALVGPLVQRHVRDRSVVVVAVDPAATEEPVALAPPGSAVHLGGLGRSELSARAPAPTIIDIPIVDVHPEADLAVLAVLAGRGGAITLVGVPATRFDVPAAAEALADLDAETVVVAGDLCPGHGEKPPRPEIGRAAAIAHDETVAAALADPAALAGLHSIAVDHGARGVPALAVAAALATRTGARLRDRQLGQVAGVGVLIARWG